MNECTGKKFILDGELQPAENFDNSQVYGGDSIYEVIRLLNGCPVFFSDHFERLTASVRLQGKSLLADESTLRRDIIKLVRSEKKHDTNLKIVFNYTHADSRYLVYFIESVYPSSSQYQGGVKGILFHAERKDPGSKVINHRLRSSISHKLIAESAYEAILVNEDNLITEGSRSNIFLLKNDILYTAPEKVILNGITRKKILEICEENNIRVEVKCINADEITGFDSVFMTGTSPVVLPFNLIGDTVFSVAFPVIRKLRDLYLVKARENIRLFLSRNRVV